MQTWLARLLNQPVAQGAVAEEDGEGREGGGYSCTGRKWKDSCVIFMLQCMYVIHIYVAACV